LEATFPQTARDERGQDARKAGWTLIILALHLSQLLDRRGRKPHQRPCDAALAQHSSSERGQAGIAADFCGSVRTPPVVSQLQLWFPQSLFGWLNGFINHIGIRKLGSLKGRPSAPGIVISGAEC